MLSSFLDGSSVSLGVALIGGFITFFASCLLPLIPTYLAYLSGVSLADEDATQERWSIVKVALFFVTGFITTFVILGALANRFAVLLVPYRTLAEQIAGIFFVILGMGMIGVFKQQLFHKTFRFDTNKSWMKGHQHLQAFFTGIGFGFGWTPCIGPVLAVILFWSAQQETMLGGISLLVAYGVGLGIPFVLVAIGFEKLIPLIKKYARVAQYATILSGVIVILAGILLFMGEFQRLSLLMLEFFKLNQLAA